jgi:membrane-associated phospholipid phosphatase
MRFSYPEIPEPEEKLTKNEHKSSKVDPLDLMIDELAVTHEKVAVEDDELICDETGSGKSYQQPDTIFTKIARLTSWIFVPLLMPVYAIIILFTLSTLNSVLPFNKWAVGGVVVGLNVLIPILSVGILRYFGVVSDIGLNRRHERLIPYIITILGIAATALYLAMRGAPHWAWMLYVAAAVTGAVNLVVNFWWKISAHAAGAAGALAIFVVLEKIGHATEPMVPWIIVGALITGFLGCCRVYLFRHTPLQVMAGYLVGFLSVIIFSFI